MLCLYQVFPPLAATSWGVTILVLLIYWLAEGRPILKSQGNPRIAYISDLGAFQLKPLFIVGLTITAVSFLASLFRIHITTARQRLARQPRSLVEIVASLLAVVSGLAAAALLILLSILDTYRYPDVHVWLLRIFCAALLLSALCTAISENGRTPASSDVKKVNGSEGKARTERWRRIYKRVIHVLIAIELVLVVVFLVLSVEESFFVNGIVEWIIAALLSPYLYLMKVYI